MAEEVVKIIKIETGGSEQTVKGLKEEINNLRDALLNTEKGSEEYKTILEQLIEDQKKLTDVMRAGQKEATAAEGSYNALVNQMAALKKVWRETTDEVSRKELGKQIKNINNQLSTMDQSIGDFRRNVGNYTQSITAAFGAMGGAAKGMIGPINGVKQAFTALSSHPLVAVITVLSALLVNGLVKGFKSSEEATNKLKTAFSGFQAIGDAITKMLQGVANAIGNVANAIVKLLDKWNMLPKSFKDRQALAQKEIDLSKKQRENIVKNADLEKEAAELRAKAADESQYTAQQRLEFLQQAGEKEAEIAENEYESLKTEYEIIKAKNELSKSSAEQKEAEAKAYEAMVRAETAYLEKKRGINKQVSSLNKQMRSDAKNQQLAMLNLEKSLIQQEYDLQVDGSKRQLELAKELRKKDLDIQIAGFKDKIKNRKDYEKAVKMATQAYNNDIIKLENENWQKQFDNTKKNNDTVVGLMRQGSIEQAAQLKANKQNEMIEIGVRYEGLRDTEIQELDEYADAIKEKNNEINALRKELVLADQNDNKEAGDKIQKQIEEKKGQLDSLVMKWSQTLVTTVLEDKKAMQEAVANGGEALDESASQLETTGDELITAFNDLKTASDNFVDTVSNTMLRQNEILLGGVKPNSRYYAMYIANYTRYLDTMLTLGKKEGESDEEWLARRREYLNKRKELQTLYRQSFVDEQKTMSEWVSTRNKMQTVEFNEDDFWLVKLGKILKSKDLDGAAENANDLAKQLLEWDRSNLKDFIRTNAMEFTQQLNDAIKWTVENSGLDESGKKELQDKLLETFGGAFPTAEQLAEKATSTTEGLTEVLNNLVRFGILPDGVLDEYLNALNEAADSEEEVLRRRAQNWQDLFSGIAQISSSMGDIVETSLDNRKKQLEREGKYNDQERKMLEDQYNRVYKPMKIAEATINTISGAIAAFMGCQELGQPWGAVLGAIQAAAVTAAGVAQIQKIASTNPYSASGSDLGGSTMMASVTPTMPDYTPQLTGTLTGEQETESLVNAMSGVNLWVNVTDINEAQEQGRVRVAESTF